ncbi:GreA/GreB family elongation factor [Mariprofundus micogutta]|nr:GreA/GreB family elongation factor [Mariprofundus micogutta]
MDKSKILNLIINQLRADLSVLEQAVEIARDTATHADCLGSSKYETMGLEASYLAQGQGTRLLAVERSLVWFKSLECTEPTSTIALSSLVDLVDDTGDSQMLWLAAEAGGLKVRYAEMEITIVTTRSPLGRALIGKEAGDDLQINIAGNSRHYEIHSVY